MLLDSSGFSAVLVATNRVMARLNIIYRLPQQWLLASLIYPPKPHGEKPNQAGLF